MRVGLFVPCYIDQLYPGVAIATLGLLEKLGCTVDYPLDQTCCGQPLANAGFEADAVAAMQLFVKNFEGYDQIVTPSGSCALHVREHYGLLEQTEAVREVRSRTYELCEFLTDVLAVETLEVSFPHRVGLHSSCHGLRGLALGRPSELNVPDFNKVRSLLEQVSGLELVELDRSDECCGFGGTFAVTEEAVSVGMGVDRLLDHLRNGVEVITSADMSCLMHLDGLARRRGMPVRVAHVAEILNGGTLP
jgi:L-lactate dehydrogenase complex protein LldE